MRTTAEEYVSSNEELKAANEELQSINEEYRSTAEELETSKEELQSLNEELQTVNVELKSKLEEITRINSDLENLITSTQIATLFLDRDLHIRYFTPSVSQVFNILSGDRGRSITHLTNKLDYDTLSDDALNVLRNLVPIEKEVSSQEDRSYLARLSPYRTVDDRIDGVILTLVDITPLKTTEAELRSAKEHSEELYAAEQKTRQALQIRVHQQSVVADIGLRALANHDLAQWMGDATRLISETLGTEFVKILELEPDQGHFLLVAGVGWKDGYVGHATEESGENSPAGYTLNALDPVIVDDLRKESRFGAPSLLQEHGIVSGSSVIIQGRERPYGVLGVYTSDKRPFRDDDIYFLQSLANVIGAAIENSRLSDHIRTTATLEERQRLGRELHDSVTQSLFAATSHAEVIFHLWEKDPDKALEILHQVIMLNRGAMAEMRTLLLELRPEAIINHSLEELYQQLVDAASTRASIVANLSVRGEAHLLPPEVHLTFYRIVQESVNNVVKHSGAKTFNIEISYENSGISVGITDDGHGFDENRIESGMGLKSMRERAEAIGAKLEINSVDGSGTIVSIHWAPS